MIDMVGVGPFITLPLMVTAMGGPQAIFGWIAGALLAMSDGLIWSELGAALPRAGGSYEYLKEIYGREKTGRLLSFLFVFQLVFSAPVSMATGCIGLATYLAYLMPALGKVFWHGSLQFQFLGPVRLAVDLSGSTLVASGTALLATFLVSRGITKVGRISQYLWVGVLGAIAFVTVAGFSHFNAAQAFPTGWAHIGGGFFSGFSAAMLFALYDYWGYYNICFLGEEVVEPKKTIPRAVLISIAAVGVLYLAMNVSILGVLPLNALKAMANGSARNFAAATAVEAVWGSRAGMVVAVLVIWTAFASVFSLLAGYSRIPFAAARDGNFPSVFGKVNPEQKFPANSAMLLGCLAAVFCVFQLKDLVSALVVIRVMLLFLVQAAGAVVWRVRKPDVPRPFRMWLYPLPVIVTIAGLTLVLHDKSALVARGLAFAAIGVALYFVREWRTREVSAEIFAPQASGSD
jgi:amino acid transporter